MGRPRKFDHDEARRLYKAGWTKAELARFFRVARPSIANVVDPAMKRAQDERLRIIFAATCEDCGAKCSKNWYSARTRLDRTVCRSCSIERMREDALLARLDENGDIHCSGCDQYKPIAEYLMRPNGLPRTTCRMCDTAARLDWRHRNRERENAWQREYKRQRRQAVA